jgi:hypothetical protein
MSTAPGIYHPVSVESHILQQKLGSYFCDVDTTLAFGGTEK